MTASNEARLTGVLINLIDALCYDESLLPDTQQDLLILKARIEDEFLAEANPTDTQPADAEAQSPAEWDGGLPPVGCECEWSDAGRPHIRVLVMGYYGESVWLRTVECQSPLTVHANYDSFRPIRTQEQIDRKGLTETIKDAARLGLNEQGISNMVWAAGWRKGAE